LPADDDVRRRPGVRGVVERALGGACFLGGRRIGRCSAAGGEERGAKSEETTRFEKTHDEPRDASRASLEKSASLAVSRDAASKRCATLGTCRFRVSDALAAS